ncbi:MAG: MFS transporter [Bacillota bacterium]
MAVKEAAFQDVPLVGDGKPRSKPHMLAALQHPNYRLFWTGQCVSVVGTWMQNVAQAWLVLELTHSAFLLGLVGTAQFAPVLLFTLFGGVVADRVPKRHLLIITQTLMMVLAFLLGLLVLTEVVRYWHVLVFALLMGTLNAVDMPARQSFIFELVGKRDLMNGIALHSSLFNAARVVGPALAGVIIARFGLAICFLVNAATFVAVVVQLIRIRTTGRNAVKSGRVLGEIVEGLRYVRRTPAIFLPILLLSAISIFAINFNVLVPVFAREVLHRGPQGLGFLLASHGAGALAGALTLAWLSHGGPRRVLLLGGAVGLCLAQMVLALFNLFWVAMVLLSIAGWSMIVFAGTVNTTIQLAATDRLRARVMSIFTLVFMGLVPIGNFISGSIAHLWNAQVAFAAGSSFALVLTCGIAFWWNGNKTKYCRAANSP